MGRFSTEFWRIIMHFEAFKKWTDSIQEVWGVETKTLPRLNMPMFDDTVGGCLIFGITWRHMYSPIGETNKTISGVDLSKRIGEAKIGGQRVVITDENIGGSPPPAKFDDCKDNKYRYK